MNRQAAADAGVVDQDVDRGVVRRKPRESGGDRRFVGDVDLEERRARPALSDRGPARVELGPGPRRDGNGRPGSANASAIARPMPRLPPVTRMVGIYCSQLPVKRTLRTPRWNTWILRNRCVPGG